MLRAPFAHRSFCALLVFAVLSKVSFGADIPIPTPPTVDARSFVVKGTDATDAVALE